MKRLRSEWGYATILELLIALVVICILLLIFLPRYLGGKSSKGEEAALRELGIKKPQTSAGAIELGKDVECMNNLKQIRSAITMFQSSEDQLPSSLRDFVPSYFSESFIKCPVGGEPYLYNPASGTVRCPHPGHEKF